MSRLIVFFTIFVLCGCSSTNNFVKVAEDKRPNFLLITTDDMGFTDLGAFGGHDIPTPNLDMLAMQGIRLTNFHANVSCAPTRAMLLSGTGNHEAGMGSQQMTDAFKDMPGYESHIAYRVATLPERLLAEGYHTYMAGKWHLASESDLGTLPGNRGFERSFALMPGGFDHFKLLPGEELPRVGRGVAEVPYSEDGRMLSHDDIPDDFYSTTAYIDKMISYLKSNEADGRPFFAWLAPTAPHWPLQLLPEWKDKFIGLYDEGYDILCRQRQQWASLAGVLPQGLEFSSCPEIAKPWSELSDDERAIHSRTMELYAAMVAHLDSEVGRLLSYLEETGQLENTYIIYHNDNGPDAGPMFDNRSKLSRFDNSISNLGNRNSWVTNDQGWADALSAPYRGDKGRNYEGGIRVAAFISPPNSNSQGTVSNSMLTVMDILPTILDLANIDENSINLTKKDALPIRGKSFATLIDNSEFQAHKANEAIALDHSGYSWLTEGDWKILRIQGEDEWQLYNLANDPKELNNIALLNRNKLIDLVSKFDQHANKIGIIKR